ncbi:MAG TPA: hypothetical protein VIF63_06735, partial [Candidatus Limnocylindrales bacterium]
VARRDAGHRAIVGIERDADPVHDYLLRVARAAEDCDRVMILGPGDDRLEFEHEYEILYRRGDRLVDVEVRPATTNAELIDRLRLLEGDELARPAG